VTVLAGRRVVHLTTTDMSLALLLGPQLRAFAEAGMEVVGASAPGPWTRDLASYGVRHEPVVHATRSMSLGKDVQALGELVRLFRRLQPDIVHTHNPKPGVYGRWAARLAGVPVVVNTVHGLYATPEDSALRRTAVYALERAAATCSQVELVQNAEDLATLERLRVPDRKLILLGNGVDLRRFRPRPVDAMRRARIALGLTDEQVVAGIVSRLVWQKGFGEVFAAARRLRSTVPNAVIVVVGPTDPTKSDGLKPADLAAAEAIGNVRFLGERRDVEDLYPAFDMFLLPSYREGFPRSAMEASACGVPVIASDIRGCRQVVVHATTGLLVRVRDADALAAAIADLAADGERRRAMGLAARIRAESEFDDQRVIERTLEVYRRLLRGAKGYEANLPSGAERRDRGEPGCGLAGRETAS
jgi:glycosyltransferase involved in cell wall biosynthesis